MKSKSVLSHLATALAATMLTVCPGASPAADDAPGSHRAAGTASSGEPQCPLPPRATAGRSAASDAGVAPATERSDPSASEQDDIAGALLEDLVRKDQ